MVWLDVTLRMASPAPTSLLSTRLLEHPRSWPGEGGAAGRGEWVGTRELWSPGRVLWAP